MNQSKHLRQFKINNFKCFQSFQMDDIGQFNLIVGDNNIGKTSVLEALLFDENIDEHIKHLNQLLTTRLGSMHTPDGEIDYKKFYLNKKMKGNNIISHYLRYANEKD